MTTEDLLDGDFATSLYERAMRDPRTIPQALSDISAAIRIMRQERERVEETIAHLEERYAALQAKSDQTGHGVDAVRSPGGLVEGSKRHRVYTIVAQLTKQKESVRTPEIQAEMERLGLFKNVGGNKRQNVANMLYDLSRSGHLASDGAGNWRLAIETKIPASQSSEMPPAAVRPRTSRTRPNSKRDRCATILQSLCENEARSAKRSEIKQAWCDAGVFDDVTDEESATSAMLTHLKNYGFITTDNRGTWTWIGLR
jgi:hypothetical protein